MSGFGTLNTAATGLSAAQRAMDITGQNIVNANTPGYSRQRVLLRSVGPPTTTSLFTGQQASYGGVSVSDVTRIRDSFLEATRAAAGGRQAALTAQAGALAGAQQLLAEPGDNGLQRSMDEFFNSWHDVATNVSPDNTAPGAVAIQSGVKVAGQLHALAFGLAQQWSVTHDALADTVSQANQAAADLAVLNGKIQEGVVAGRPVNELLDSRDQLVRQLSDLVGGVALPGEDGQVQVSVGGVTVVAGTHAQQLTLGGATDITTATTDPPTVYWGTTAVPVESGRALGQLASLRTDLPSALGAVDQVAVSLRDAVNALHGTGFTLAGAPGGLFFDGTDALTIGVVPTSAGDLAVASAPGTVDGSVAAAIGDLSDERKASAALGGGLGPSARWRELSTSLGVQLKSLQTAGSVQQSVVNAADDALEADAGVSLDEEMGNMILFQRSYQASARVITTVDEMLDTLINRTGTVGR
jgi:flagellar hook-associated protein 1 FlgK